MKHLCIGILLAIPTLLSAQTSFAPLGATWYYEKTPFWPFITLDYSKLEVTAIDTIQGRPCSRIEATDWGCSFYWPLLYTWSDNGKVYSYHDNDFYLLYDFNANAGDSWVIHNPPVALGDSMVVIVDSVRFININGQDRKVQYVSNPGLSPGGQWEWGSVIVEGIGNLSFLTPQYPACDPWIYGMRCYDDNLLSLHLVNFPCDSIGKVAVSEPVSRGGLFQPNPVTEGFITLSESVEADQVEVISAMGTLEKRMEIMSDNRLDISELPTGVHLMQLYRKGVWVGTDRVLVLRN